MSDRSLPVGDRTPTPPASWGPGMARDALARSALPQAEHAEQVVRLAKRAGWRVVVPGPHSDPGCPLLFVRPGRPLVAAHVGTAPPGFAGDEWASRLRQAGAEVHRWPPRDGLGPVEAVLAPTQAHVDRCGQPSSEPDA